MVIFPASLLVKLTLVAGPAAEELGLLHLMTTMKRLALAAVELVLANRVLAIPLCFV